MNQIRASDPHIEMKVVVIGAGAAGIAASRALHEASIPHLVLEARTRLGGRAWTDRGHSAYPLDLGCGWLHSTNRNPWCAIAEARGFTIDRTPPPWSRLAGTKGFTPALQAEFRAASDAFYERLEAARQEPADHKASDYLDPACRWNRLLDAGSTYYNGAALDRVSVQDFGYYLDTEINWRVVEGYGAAIAAHGAGLPIRLGCPVSEIGHGGARLRVVTAQGELQADAAIVTISTNLLAAERLRFTPALPGKVEAASRLPLGYANKIIFALGDPEAFPEGGRMHGALDRTETGGYHLRPFGRPLIEGYFGGEFARALEQEGEAAFADFAMEELVGQLGSGIRAGLHLVAVTGWAGDEYALGSYSHALPGYADARATLAAPVDGRIFFAGEACSKHSFSTAHGAYETGIEAAAQAIAALGKETVHG